MHFLRILQALCILVQCVPGEHFIYHMTPSLLFYSLLLYYYIILFTIIILLLTQASSTKRADARIVIHSTELSFPVCNCPVSVTIRLGNLYSSSVSSIFI